ncbi:S8 family serine peptidase, partial [Candidatus Pelagibacter sp.]|nr:S8 family serine peptidase [Candidatus Pelagibacter sp.]
LILALPFLFSACGGGGGDGAGSSSESVGGRNIPTCSGDSSTYTTAEYNFMGGGNSAGTGSGKYGLGSVCAGAAYARDATGEGIDIAVLDTGISVGSGSTTDINDIDTRIATFVSGADIIDSDSVPEDDQGHGSHVAGIIANEKNGSGLHGVAYEADLHIIRVLNEAGSSESNSVASGLDKARDISGLDIANMSLGAADVIGTTCNTAATCETYLGSTKYTALEAFGSAGIIAVWAAGNEGDSSPSVLSGAALYDDDFKETTVIAVGIGADGLLSTTGYASNYCGIAAAICIAAPSGGNGKYLYSNFSSNAQSTYGVNSYARGAWGTSMAAPMVSGGLALIKQEFSSLSNAAVVDRLFATALDTDEYSKSTIYGHGLMNLSAATAAIGSLQTINGSNLLDDPNTSYYDLVDNSFTTSAAFSNALSAALEGQTMEVYDSFDRANFKTNVSSFFTSGSYTSQNTIENHMARLQPKTKNETSVKNLYGNFDVEFNGDYIGKSLFQSTGDFLALGYNQSTNSFENDVDPLSEFFNESSFGNKYLVNPYFYTDSGQDYFMSFNNSSSFGIDTFTNANSSDLGFAFNFNPLSSKNGDYKSAGDLQLVLGTNSEENKFLNSTSSGVFSTGEMSNTNFTGLKYKKKISDDLTFVGSGFAGYTHIDKAANSYIDSSTPLLTSSFTLGLAKSNFIKENQGFGFFINQPQRVEDGNINLRVPTSSDRDRTVTYSNLDVDLEPDARQINYDIIFNKSITDSSNLSANLTHVQNGDHSSNSKDQNFISIFYKKTF